MSTPSAPRGRSRTGLGDLTVSTVDGEGLQWEWRAEGSADVIGVVPSPRPQLLCEAVAEARVGEVEPRP
ncbi:MAG: hypothetical protein ACTH1E_09185, partial [Brevibacterium yomogidense]